MPRTEATFPVWLSVKAWTAGTRQAIKQCSICSEKGDVTLLLASDAGFVLTNEMHDGKTPTIDFAVEQRDGAYVCGDGRSQIDVKADRGSVSVKKMK